MIGGGRGKAPGSPYRVVGQRLLDGTLALSLGLNLAVANDLRGFFGILGRGLNQLGDVLQELIELCSGHFQFLTSFPKSLYRSALHVI